MRKLLLFSLMLTLISSLSCSGKKEKRKIEIKNPDKNQTSKRTNVSKSSLTLETFFRITTDIYRVSNKYSSMTGEDQKSIEESLEKMDQEIIGIYKKHNTTKEEFETFGEENYSDLEAYRKAHPEIDKELRNTQ